MRKGSQVRKPASRVSSSTWEEQDFSGWCRQRHHHPEEILRRGEPHRQKLLRYRFSLPFPCEQGERSLERAAFLPGISPPPFRRRGPTIATRRGQHQPLRRYQPDIRNPLPLRELPDLAPGNSLSRPGRPPFWRSVETWRCVSALFPNR